MSRMNGVDIKNSNKSVEDVAVAFNPLITSLSRAFTNPPIPKLSSCKIVLYEMFLLLA